MDRILIVDDNATNLKLAAEVLQSQGFEVVGAVDAEHALLLLGDSHPDLILMDIALPGMDGLTLARKLKTYARYNRIPIIALTAFAMKGDDQKALAAGCMGYITKPFKTRELGKQVRTYLAQSRGADPCAS